MRTIRTRATAVVLAGTAVLLTGTACSVVRANKCGGQAFQESHGGTSAPLSGCGGTVGQPVSAPSGVDPADYNLVTPTLTVKAGETLTIGYLDFDAPPTGSYSGVASSEPAVLALASGVDGRHLGVFRALAPGTSQITIDPLVACGSATVRCLVVTVTVTSA